MFTILSARYSNADQTAVLAMTEESASVLITRSPGKADKWAALEEWVEAGGVIAPFEPRVAPKARDLAAELDKLRTVLVQKSLVTEEEVSELEFAADDSARAMHEATK